jgi:cbb3-type cytochrome oxidase subunit 3
MFHSFPREPDMQTLGWIAVGALVMLGVGLMFLLDITLGLVFSIFCLGVLYWVYGVVKKAKDKEIEAAANALGLQFKRHPLRYGPIEGSYNGHRVRISYEGGATFSAGSILAVSTGKPGLAALDIRNVTVVRLETHIEKEWLNAFQNRQIEAAKNGIQTRIDGVCTDVRRLKKALDKLVEAASTAQLSPAR